jgi:hypothetical protein
MGDLKTMNIKDVLKSQYHAALEMLKQAIFACPESLWDDKDHKNRFWHIAYHALFYTHLYMQPTEQDFIPWTKHKEPYNFMGPLPWPPHDEPEIGEPYSKAEILAYHEKVRTEVEATIDSIDLEAESGFYWIPLRKMELQFYNIRHLQHHAGELCERLGTEAGIDVDWIGMKPDHSG